MAIALDTTTNGGPSNNIQSNTWSHTCTGSNLILVVTVGYDVPTVPIATVTYNGVALTQAVIKANGANNAVEIWYLVNPATGAHNIVVDYGTGNANYFSSTAISFTGVNTSNPIDTTATFSGTTANPSSTITTSRDGYMVVDVFATDSQTQTAVATGPSNLIFNNNDTWNTVASSYQGPISPAATVTMAYTGVASSAVSKASISLAGALTVSVSDSSTATDIIGVLTTTPPRQIPQIEFTTPDDSQLTVLSGNFKNIQPLTDVSGASDQTGFGLYFPGRETAAGTAKVTVTNNAVLQSLTAMTIEAWIYLVSQPLQLDRVVDYVTGNTGFLFESRAGGPLRLLVAVGNGTTQASATTVALNTNTWYHVAGSWDGSNLRIFVNGVLGQTSALSGGNTGNPAVNVTIGNGSGGGREFPGIIKEIRISNNARYTSGFSVPTSEFVSDGNTLALWHMDDGSGTSLSDSSSNTLTGTLSGAPFPQWVTSTAPITPFGGTVMAFFPVAPNDSSIVTDSLTIAPLICNISVFDSSTITENRNTVSGFSPSTSDASTVTDVLVQILLIDCPSVFDVSGASDQTGFALSFNTTGAGGGSQNVLVTNIGTLQNLTSFTFEAWIYMTDTPTTLNRIMDYSNTGAHAGFYVVAQSISRLGAQVNNGTTTISFAASNNSIPLNQWTHIALTWNNTIAILWINGVSSGTSSLSGGNIGNPGVNFSIGNSPSGGGRGFPGIIKEVRYSNVARYNTTFSIPTSEFASDGNTIGLWHLDDGSGTTAIDSSSNGLTGTLNNSPQWVTSTAPITGFDGIIETVYPLPLVFDSSTVTDTPTIFLPYISETVFDSSVVTENTTIFLPYLAKNVSDSSIVTDITDVIRAQTRDIPTPSEGIDYLSLENNSFLLQENGSHIILDGTIPLAVTESLTAYSENQVVNDSSTVTDSTSLSIINPISVFDLSKVTDSDVGALILTPSNQIGFIEFTTPIEFSQVQSGLMLNLSISDSITVIDIAGSLLVIQPRQIVFIEFVPITDSIAIAPNIPLIISDSSAVTESLTIPPLGVSVNIIENSQVTEQTPYQIIQQESLVNFPTTGIIKDNASWSSFGWIQLTSNNNNQHGEFEYSGILPSIFEVLFDLNVVGQADATYFYWGCARTPLNELDNAGGYIFALKETSSSGTPYLWEFNGAQVATQGSVNWVDGAFHTVRLEISGNTLTAYLDNIQQFTFTDTTRTLGGTLYGYGARTGGQSATHLIRNTSVTTLAPVRVLETTFFPIVTDSSTVTDVPIVEKVEEPIISDTSVVTDVVTSIIRVTTVSLFEASTVTENIIAYTEGEAVFDFSTVTEDITLQIIYFVNSFDSSTVAEDTLQVSEAYGISTGEDSTSIDILSQILFTNNTSIGEDPIVTELVIIQYSQLDINPGEDSTVIESLIVEIINFEILSDSSSVTESATVFLPYFAEVVFDSSMVTEDAPILILSPYTPVAFESSTVTDSLNQILLTDNINTSDLSTATESTTVNKLIIISISDSSTATDVITQILFTNNIVVNDISAITEQLFFNNYDFESIFEATTATDVSTVAVVYCSVVSDASTVTDIVTQILLSNFINIFDASVVSENIIVFIPTLLYSVFDISAITDFSSVEVIDTETLFDSSAVTENTTLAIFSLILVTDDSSISDNITIGTVDTEVLFDSSIVNDSVTQIIQIYTENIFESSMITENIVVEVIDFESLLDFSTVIDTVTILIPILKYSVFDASKVIDVPVVEPFYFNNAPLYYGLDTGEISIMLGDNKMPMWNNTENRPVNPPIGAFGFNYTAGQLEIWDGKVWRKVTLS